ncbi:hypothetical protein K458DRAFT_423916 [Lentithecium fluviatile CBS 122367]|uniref:Uncharacterized protein n=1 Tax=Lentithecium fluviatile CBS 122367 TaxID=1168545 RepID=A0A6G1IGT6_9PLEO|nr:hypothetical protein K458DRAFT_423916 [Lentithecium fluviatile CBS 122367]
MKLLRLIPAIFLSPSSEGTLGNPFSLLGANSSASCPMGHMSPSRLRLPVRSGRRPVRTGSGSSDTTMGASEPSGAVQSPFSRSCLEG